jgi:hypothetical protein
MKASARTNRWSVGIAHGGHDGSKRRQSVRPPIGYRLGPRRSALSTSRVLQMATLETVWRFHHSSLVNGETLMPEFFQEAAAIISAAAQSTLGIIALLILVVAVVGFFFFRRDSQRVRLAVFFTFVIGTAAFVTATLTTANSGEVIEFAARDATRYTGVKLAGSAYGANVVQNSNDEPKLNELEYTVSAPNPGTYELSAMMAAASPRPCTILVNGVVVLEGVFGITTGSWFESSARWTSAGTITLRQGQNTFAVRQLQAIPHFTRFRLVPTDGV